jgi:hypothetical protein
MDCSCGSHHLCFLCCHDDGITLSCRGFEPDTSATDATEIVNHRVDSLAAEVKALREHNEEMAKYLEAWTPLKCRRELGVREKWPLGVPGLGLPEIVPNSYLQVEGAFICE